jgi:hypothetical protein
MGLVCSAAPDTRALTTECRAGSGIALTDVNFAIAFGLADDAFA